MALGAAVMAIAAALPVHAETRAGGWATTELDPLPDKLVADKAYTIGYWVLQHGTHPFDVQGEDLGTTGLRLISTSGGTTLNFTGTPLPEPAHYAVTIKIPDGQWRLQGVQGIFMPHEIGTLVIPGGLTLAPPQFARGVGAEVVDYWGSIKPPSFPWDGKVTSSRPPAVSAPQPSAPQAPAAAPAPSPQRTATPASGDDGWSVPYLPIVTALLAIGATLLVQRAARARVRQGPADGAARGGTTPDETGPTPPGDAAQPGQPGSSAARKPSEQTEEDVITIGRD
ncbi:hypothetical protein Pth03_65310 [Planotetraspora thailandica]|uniref:Uncharacterized protein n=1 Tax=Planotetraspora thailandica TaxID=487172 RepID=A0A8J4DE29_9ACTN|nr:hypothetical protein Pth03_65310 [Planotetraspora thailandica]